MLAVAREDPERVPYFVGRRLAELRLAKRWTQQQAAEHLGLSVRHLQRLENGWNMTVLTAARLARRYGVPTWQLFVAPRLRQPFKRGRPRKSDVG